MQHEEPSARSVALYARQSKSDRDGIDRQLPRLRAMAEQRGWTVFDEYVDDGLSATRQRGPSSEWSRMLADATQGRIDTVVAVDLDRLLRSLSDLLVLIEHGLMAVTSNGEIDLTSADGEFRATILAAVARFEVRRKGERQSRAQEQRATQGRAPKGQRPLGYAVNGDVIAHEAAAVREMYRLFAIDDGPSTASIARGLSGRTGDDVPKTLPHLPKHSRTVMIERNELRAIAGEPLEPVPEDGPWHPSTVLGILRNPRYAGYSTYTPKTLPPVTREDGSSTGRRRSWRASILRDDTGEPVRGQWEPLVDELTWWRVQERLDDPRRITNKTGSTARKHLGSGLYLCGECGKPVRSWGTKYGCSDLHFARTRTHVDHWVLAVIRERLARPDLQHVLVTSDEPRQREIQQEIEARQAKIKRATRDYDLEIIEGYDLKRIRSAEQSAIEALEDELRSLTAPGQLGDVLAAPDPVAAFDDADLMTRRRIVDLLCTVTLHPHPRGKKGFSPDTVTIVPK